jgi:predicted ATPase/DNA-binding CsgD family transcriptional regulator
MSTDTSLVRGNLPAEPNRFIGRERDLAELALLLTDVRVLTLCGTGGIGKTRLALRLGAEVAAGFPDGVWLAGLADVTAPAFVTARISAALGVREEPGQPLEATLADALRGQRLLLILDNCEHVVTACAQLCEYLLANCRWLRIMATSREPLRVPGETIWRVPPLSLPPEAAAGSAGLSAGSSSGPSAGFSPEELTQHEAVRLFAERAAAARPGFNLGPQNAAAVAGVCRTLDGMPLAIELAAARVGALAVEQINGRLSDRFQLLAGGHRTAAPRQRTLRATVDWSYELLTEPEQLLLRRLAVFSGWNLDMAERVCADEKLPAQAVLDLLAALIDKSLVALDGEVAGDARYRLLDTIRQYAAERLAASGEAAQIRRRHRDCLIELVEGIAARAFRRGNPSWEDRVRSYQRAWLEIDNFRAALDWSLQEGEAAQGMRLCTGLRSPWVTDGDVAEGASWLDRFLAADGDVAPVIRGRALVVRAELAFEQQEYGTARRCAHAGLKECSATGDESFVAGALRVLGSVELRLGDAPRAQELAGEAAAAAREAGSHWEEGLALGTLAAAAARQGRIREAQRTYEDALEALCDNNRWGTAHVRYGMAMLAQARGDHEGSLGHLGAALEIFRELDARPEIARCLAGLGRVAMAQQQYAAARERLGESLRLSRATGQRLAVARGLEAFAQLAAGQGQHARAVRLGGAARALRAAIGASPASGARLEALLEPARRLLGEPAAAALLAAGGQMTMAEAAEYAADPDAEGPSPQPAAPAAPRPQPGSVLTAREWEIAELIARGLSNRAIAADLVISPATAARHVANILTKLGFSSRAQVAAWVTGQHRRRDANGSATT